MFAWIRCMCGQTIAHCALHILSPLLHMTCIQLVAASCSASFMLSCGQTSVPNLTHIQCYSIVTITCTILLHTKYHIARTEVLYIWHMSCILQLDMHRCLVYCTCTEVLYIGTCTCTEVLYIGACTEVLYIGTCRLIKR